MGSLSSSRGSRITPVPNLCYCSKCGQIIGLGIYFVIDQDGSFVHEECFLAAHQTPVSVPVAADTANIHTIVN